MRIYLSIPFGSYLYLLNFLEIHIFTVILSEYFLMFGSWTVFSKDFPFVIGTAVRVLVIAGTTLLLAILSTPCLLRPGRRTTAKPENGS